MASFQKREKNGKPSYTAKIRIKGHKPVFKTFDRLTDARDWAAKTETEIKEGLYKNIIEAQRHTFTELVERFKRDVVPRKPKVGKEYARQLEWWRTHLGDLTLNNVSSARISELRDQLANGTVKWGTNLKEKKTDKRSHATVNRYLAALSSAFGIAVKEWQWIDENPMRRVSKLKEPRGRVRCLTEEERERLLVACKNSTNNHLYLAVVLALSTGARQQEIWGLRWSEVNFETGFITFTETKNEESRSVPLKGHACKLLLEHYRIRRKDSDIVFPSKKNPAVSYDFRNPWKKALVVAEVEDFRWHDLRHSCASYLAMNGVPMRTIAEILGHKTLSMVQRYTHLNAEHLSEAISDMNRKFVGNRS
jgi:integrase